MEDSVSQAIARCRPTIYKTQSYCKDDVFSACMLLRWCLVFTDKCPVVKSLLVLTGASSLLDYIFTVRNNYSVSVYNLYYTQHCINRPMYTIVATFICSCIKEAFSCVSSLRLYCYPYECGLFLHQAHG